MLRLLAHTLCALAVATPGPCLWPVALPGDANGDAVVDVRDLQIVIAAVFDESLAPMADVNHDGVVNILDFQLVQARAQERDSASPPAPDDTPAPPVGVSNPLPTPPSLTMPVLRIAALERTAVRPAPASLRRTWTEREHRSPRCERYDFRLTPNAPPEAC